MKIKANLLNRPNNFQMDDCQIEKVVELSTAEFSALVITPLTNQPFIAENKSRMFVDNRAIHCAGPGQRGRCAGLFRRL